MTNILERREYRAAYAALLDAEARGATPETRRMRRVDLLGAWVRAREAGVTEAALRDIRADVPYPEGC